MSTGLKLARSSLFMVSHSLFQLVAIQFLENVIISSL